MSPTKADLQDLVDELDGRLDQVVDVLCDDQLTDEEAVTAAFEIADWETWEAKRDDEDEDD